MPTLEVDGNKIHLRTFGDGPPVLGIMGFGLDQRFWAAQVPAITPRNTFITFDPPSVGRSTGPAATSLEETADLAVKLLDELGHERATIFGASMGGAIAQHLVLRHPERVSGLVLAITWARPLEYQRRQLEVTRKLVAAQGMESFMDAALLFMFTPRFFEMGRDNLDRMIASFAAPGAPEMMSAETLGAQMDAIGKHDVIDRLPQIAVPTLVVGGRFDMMVPGFASEEIARAIPGAKLEMFDSGHGLLLEEMEAFNTLMRSFLDDLLDRDPEDRPQD